VGITEGLTRRLIERTLPKAAWTHHAHLRAGLWHVREFGPAGALVRLRTTIAAYNESIGTANTDTSGYHETITRFYVAVIARFLDEDDGSRPLDMLAERLIAKYGERDLPLRFYTRERLFSVEARRGWVEPDLLGLPFEWSQHHPANQDDPGR
jgi:hypothetical protein